MRLSSKLSFNRLVSSGASGLDSGVSLFTQSTFGSLLLDDFEAPAFTEDSDSSLDEAFGCLPVDLIFLPDFFDAELVVAELAFVEQLRLLFESLSSNSALSEFAFSFNGGPFDESFRLPLIDARDRFGMMLFRSTSANFESFAFCFRLLSSARACSPFRNTSFEMYSVS